MINGSHDLSGFSVIRIKRAMTIIRETDPKNLPALALSYQMPVCRSYCSATAPGISHWMSMSSSAFAHRREVFNQDNLTRYFEQIGEMMQEYQHDANKTELPGRSWCSTRSTRRSNQNRLPEGDSGSEIIPLYWRYRIPAQGFPVLRTNRDQPRGSLYPAPVLFQHPFGDRGESALLCLMPIPTFSSRHSGYTQSAPAHPC